MLLTNITNMAWTLLLNKAGIKIFLFLLVFYSTFHCVTCEVKKCNAFDTPGVTIPEGDIILEHGESLEIFCKLHDHYMAQHPNVTSADIEFLKDNFILPSEWVTKLNDSTARLYVEKPPPSSSFYICRIKSNQKAVCLNTVTVGTKPSEVQNFSCTAYNYENMTCSWTEPNHYVKTNYNLTYYFAGRGSRSIYMCPNITRRDDKGYCFWDLQTRPHYRQTQPNYYFSLNVSNDFGTIIQKITFSHFANVIPGPPENLTVLNKTSDSVTLSWSVRHPMIFFPPSVIHRVVFQSEYDKKDEWMVANTSSINKNNRPLFTLDSLKYAHALYDIRVSMISSKARISDDRMWSKNVSLTVRTLSALPGAPPKTTVGSFEIVNNKTGRDVYLYWQFIPEFMKNGENLTYRVIQVTDDFTTKVIEPVELTNSYAKIVSISYSKRYKFHIVSENEVGQSVNRSEIIVPAIAEQVKEPSSFTKISFGKQVYELSWIPPPDNNNTIKNYTIFYCRNDYDRPFQCKGLLKWIEVPSNTTLINMTVPEDKIYQFAISANSENSSSGMVWASCTVIHDKGFTKMKSIWINSIGSDYIEVGWKLDCSDRIGNIEGFIIYYCPIVSPVDAACNGSEQNITITGDPIASRGKITNLRPYTTYMLNVSVKSKHNNGLPSDPLYNTTLEGAPDPPENLTVNNITSNSITISWMPPKYMNGVIRFYEVRYFSNGGEYRRKTEDGKTHFMTLRNLHTYTEYNITVYAVTVKESNSSLTLGVKTAISVPAKMDSPSNKYQNDTLILVVWTPPNPAGGNLDLYELRVKEKVNSVNDTKYFNTSDTQFEITNCGNDRTYKVLYFSIRAINIDETLNKRYEGEWSDETEYYCRSSTGFIYWFAIACGVGILIFMVYILKKLWHHCKIMRDVEVKLPPGLTPTAPNDLSLNHWPVSTLQKPSTDDPLMHIRTDSSADEELLLAKKAECGESHDRIPSGDSSGCSSGHESVTSSLASGTNLSSSSDSGTEQPRTPSSESVSRENSLRQRRTGSETLGWDSEIAWPHPKGYVTTMPMSDKSGSPTWNTISPSNYCVLGVDTVTAATDNPIHGGYVPVPISIPHSEPAGKPLSSYITCDSIFNKPQPIGSGESSPAYVKSSDIIGRGTGTGIGLGVATTATVTSAVQPQQPTYVMAGNTNTSRPYVKPSALAAVAATTATGKLINIEPLHGVDVEAYMQHGSEIDSPTPYVKADELSSLKENDEHSYCRMGWDRDRNRTGGGGVGAGSPVSIPTAVPARSAVCEPAKGYVPHRQFENKSLKED